MNKIKKIFLKSLNTKISCIYFGKYGKTGFEG